MTRDTTLHGHDLGPHASTADVLRVHRELIAEHLAHAEQRAAESPLGPRSPWPQMVTYYGQQLETIDRQRSPVCVGVASDV